MEKLTARLENWYIINEVLWGHIFDQSGFPRFEDGTLVRTSRIEKLNLEEQWVETRNTVYTLGQQFSRWMD